MSVNSTECPQVLEVKPGDPTQSYLAFKLADAGPCFKGGKMPPGGALSAADSNTIRGWISAGAPNN